MGSFEQYNSLVRHLKRNVKLDHPVSVLRTRMSSALDGDATLHAGKFTVRINRELQENSAIDALIHEISHCVVLETHQGHGTKWGKAYSKVYREYLRWLEEE